MKGITIVNGKAQVVNKRLRDFYHYQWKVVRIARLGSENGPIVKIRCNSFGVNSCGYLYDVKQKKTIQIYCTTGCNNIFISKYPSGNFNKKEVEMVKNYIVKFKEDGVLKDCLRVYELHY